MNARARILLGISIVLAVETACAQRASPAVDPSDARVEKLAASAFGVLQTHGYAHAFAKSACGPTDGPAVSLYLVNGRYDEVPPATTYIRVTFSLPVADVGLLAHQSFQWDVSPAGVGELCSSGSCAAVKRGHIEFGGVDSHRVDGYLDLHFTNDIRVRRSFRADWRRRPRRSCP
jgi:hypothetical protein